MAADRKRRVSSGDSVMPRNTRSSPWPSTACTRIRKRDSVALGVLAAGAPRARLAARRRGNRRAAPAGPPEHETGTPAAAPNHRPIGQRSPFPTAKPLHRRGSYWGHRFAGWKRCPSETALQHRIPEPLAKGTAHRSAAAALRSPASHLVGPAEFIQVTFGSISCLDVDGRGL